jgi:hypothetical protein
MIRLPIVSLSADALRHFDPDQENASRLHHNPTDEGTLWLKFVCEPHDLIISDFWLCKHDIHFSGGQAVAQM